MPVATVTTSAAGSLHLLEDDDAEVRGYALQHLLAIVPQFWAEISDKLSYIESLADPLTQDAIPSDDRPLAALLISKVYFYMGELDEAVEFALRAGSAFDKQPEGEYKETIIAGCLDRAIRQTQDGEKLDQNLSNVVDGVLRSTSSENGKLAMGLALSLRRLDLIEMIFLSSRAPSSTSSSSAPQPAHDESLLRYVLNEVVSGTSGNELLAAQWRSQLFQLLLRLFGKNPSPDYNSITTLWVQSEAFEACGDELIKLLKSEKTIEAYQIAFDVAEVASQGFIEGVRRRLEDNGEGPEARVDEENAQESPRVILDDILHGTKSAILYLNFLNKNNQTDMSILKATKDTLEDRYSIYHEAITFTNAFANCGTSSDKFLRENLDWLGRASNWAKFSTTAALGLIHRRSWRNGARIVKPYLPGGSAPNVFSEGGALFALGLIYVGHREGCEADLRKGLAEGNDVAVQHGAALGLGVSGIASADEALYEEIRNVLFHDNATAGEAAGYAMGMVMLGTASKKAHEEMISYTRETQHEKIIRSLAVGAAFLQYGAREEADPVIDSMLEEKDAILRYGGMFAIAMAYAGTGNNRAIRRLLHVAVSDVNDDVRRAAVTSLGFVLFRNYTQVPRVVQLLAESYNPYVRHGATIALGISCAGTGLSDAVGLLEPLTKDPVDFVRQGAFIALAMILMQQSDAQSPKVSTSREMFASVVADKHEDPMARFGASLAQGIIDAGGRNMTLSLSTRAGTLNMNAIVGMALFVQFWYWFPLAHGLGLALSPTAIIAVDEKLRCPVIDLTCHAKASTFAYSAGAKKEVEKKEKKAKPATLSTTAKARAREKSKKEDKGEAMDTDEKEERESTPPVEADATAAPARTPAKRRPQEPSSFAVPNLSRVTPLQLPFMSMPEGRYMPLRPIGSQNPKEADKRTMATDLKRGLGGSSGNIIVVRDSKPEDDGEYIELNKALWPEELGEPEEAEPEAEETLVAETLTEEQEAAPPPPFEFPFED